MGTFQLVCDLDIVRRIGWSDQALGEHIDSVLDRLHQADGVEAVEVEADLDSGRTALTLGFKTRNSEPGHVGRVTLGVAIRSCRGMHAGLLPLGQEAVLKPDGNQWSGLRSPTWQVRRIDLRTTSAV